MSDEDLVRGLIKRRDSLVERRGQWASHWDDLARVQLPRRLGFVSQTTEGDRRTEEIYDGTPMQAARGLANALGGMLRPDGEDWHQIKTVDDADEKTDEAKDWLADVDKKMREAIENPKARFRQATGEVDIDEVVLGTGVLFVGEGDESLLFQSLHLKDALPIFGETGNPEGMLRDRTLTVRQAVARFQDKVSDEVQAKFTSGLFDDKVQYLHAVVPRDEGRGDALFARNLPIADLWIDIEDKKIAAGGGFHEFPFAVPRWDTSSGEDYGRSPGMIALPDSNTVQAMGATILVAGQRAADPPLAVPDDGVFDAPNTFPGGLAYYDVELARQLGRIPIGPLDSGGNIPITREMQADFRDQIWNAFFRNILRLPVGGPEMTAFEVNERKEEFIREIGPVFGRQETDYTAPIIERVFKIMLRAGAFLPIPDVLSQKGVRFEYASPIKRIRQQIEANAARAWKDDLMASAEFKPEGLDLINMDAYGRFTAEAAGIPSDIVNGEDAVAQIRTQRAEQQAQEAELAQLQAGVETASTAANIPGLKDALEGAQAA